MAADDRNGSFVSSAGDVNGDGFDDIVVASLNAGPNGPDSGSSCTIFGRASDHTLRGNAGNDTLDGGTGADLMCGGSGDDVYFVGNSGGLVFEAAGEGADTVFARTSFAPQAGQSIVSALGLGSRRTCRIRRARQRTRQPHQRRFLPRRVRTFGAGRNRVKILSTGRPLTRSGASQWEMPVRLGFGF